MAASTTSWATSSLSFPTRSRRGFQNLPTTPDVVQTRLVNSLATSPLTRTPSISLGCSDGSQRSHVSTTSATPRQSATRTHAKRATMHNDLVPIRDSRRHAEGNDIIIRTDGDPTSLCGSSAGSCVAEPAPRDLTGMHPQDLRPPRSHARGRIMPDVQRISRATECNLRAWSTNRRASNPAKFRRAAENSRPELTNVLDHRYQRREERSTQELHDGKTYRAQCARLAINTTHLSEHFVELLCARLCYNCPGLASAPGVLTAAQGTDIAPRALVCTFLGRC